MFTKFILGQNKYLAKKNVWPTIFFWLNKGWPTFFSLPNTKHFAKKKVDQDFFGPTFFIGPKNIRPKKRNTKKMWAQNSFGLKGFLVKKKKAGKKKVWPKKMFCQICFWPTKKRVW